MTPARGQGSSHCAAGSSQTLFDAHCALEPQRHAPLLLQLLALRASQVTQAAPPVPQCATLGV